MEAMCPKCPKAAQRVVMLTRQDTTDRGQTATYFLGREFHHEAEGENPSVCVDAPQKPALMSLGEHSIERVDKPGEIITPKGPVRGVQPGSAPNKPKPPGGGSGKK